MLVKVLLILALIGLVIALFKVRKAPATFLPIAYGLVALVVVLVLVRLFSDRSAPPPPVRIVMDFPTASGARLGQEIARTVPGGGDILVVVIEEDADNLEDTLTGAQVEGLKQGLGEAYRLVIVSPPDEPPFVVTMRMLARLAQATPEAKAIVSLMGFPDSRDSPARDLPPLFVIDMMPPQAARPLIARGLIRAGVFAKPDADWFAEPPPDMTLDEIFDMRYVLVTGDR